MRILEVFLVLLTLGFGLSLALAHQVRRGGSRGSSRALTRTPRGQKDPRGPKKNDISKPSDSESSETGEVTTRSAARFGKGLPGWIAPPVLMVILFVLHLTFEGYRWPLIPLYVLIVLSLVGGVLAGLRYRLGVRVVGWVIAGFSFLALAVGILVPVELMPRPSGEFQVGTMVFEVSDPDRLEPYGSAPEGLRRFRVQVWYPSEDTEGYQRADWLEDGRVVAPAVSRAMGFPPYLLSYGQLVTSNAYWNAPVISGEGLPFVIISHGWTGFKNLHADIAEDLASTGVVVMAIDHSFASAGTLFDDGQVALLIPEILPKRGEPGFLSDARGLILTFSADIQRLLDVVLNKTEQVRPSNGAARTGISGEVEFDTREPKLGITVLTGSDPSGASAAESLGKIDQQLGKVFQAVDSEFIGLVGHSTGAGAVVQTAIADPRIRGIVGMDPWVEPLPIELLEQGLPVPALLFRSEAWQNHPNDENLERLTMTARDSLGVFQIDGSTHNDFTMAYMFGPLGRFFGTLGSIGQQNMRNILTDSIRGFFTVLADPNPRAVDLFHAAAGHPQVGIAGF